MDDRTQPPTSSTPRNCQSCDRPDQAEEEMVQCSVCQLWQHFGGAGVDGQVKRPEVKYICERCDAKQGTSNNLFSQAPTDGARLPKGTKAASKAGSKRGKKAPEPPKSTTSSMRVALLEEQLKLVEEDLRLKEQELLEQDELKQRQLKEEERQLEEKRKLVEEERSFRERKLNEELALKKKQQQIRRESFEKRQAIIRQQAEMSSRSGSVSDVGERVKSWLDSQANAVSSEMVNENNGNDNLYGTSRPRGSLEDVVENHLHVTDPVLAPEHRRFREPASLQQEFTPFTQKLTQVQIAARQVLGKEHLRRKSGGMAGIYK